MVDECVCCKFSFKNFKRDLENHPNNFCQEFPEKYNLWAGKRTKLSVLLANAHVAENNCIEKILTEIKDIVGNLLKASWVNDQSLMKRIHKVRFCYNHIENTVLKVNIPRSFLSEIMSGWFELDRLRLSTKRNLPRPM